MVKDPAGVTRNPCDEEPEHYSDLGALRQEAFRLLSLGVADRRSAFHTPGLVTIGQDGFPEARTVVLRGFDPDAVSVTVHTDSRSRKIPEIMANRRVSLVFYDARIKIQLRLKGEAAVHVKDDVARQSWERTTDASRSCYLTRLAPGSASAVPRSGLEDSPTSDAQGFDSFAVVRVTISSLEWLYLSANGHRRARLSWNGGTIDQASWLIP